MKSIIDVLPPPTYSLKEGWKRWVEQKGSKPPKISTTTEWNSMSSTERRRFDAARRRHWRNFGPIMSKPMECVLDVLDERVSNNEDEQPGARPGVVIDGEAAVGKTTLAAYFGRELELDLRVEHGSEWDEQAEYEWHPVVFHGLDVPSTVRNLNIGIANFYGTVVPDRATTAWLTDKIIEDAQKRGTVLFIIDDVHYLDWNRESTREVNDHLKLLANETSATFVYAGVDIANTKLLTEGENANSHYGQTRRRFTVQKMRPFTVKPYERFLEWCKLLNTLEENLLLQHQEPGTLASMAEHIYVLTGGYWGSLRILLRTAAYRAILSGEEKITYELLENIPLDHAATEELSFRRRTR